MKWKKLEIKEEGNMAEFLLVWKAYKAMYLTYSRLKTGNQINSSGLRYIQTCIFVVVVITVKHTGN